MSGTHYDDGLDGNDSLDGLDLQIATVFAVASLDWAARALKSAGAI